MVPLFTVTTLNDWLLRLVRKVAMAVNANSFNLLELWTCPPLLYWKRCQYSGSHVLVKMRLNSFQIKDVYAVGSIPLQSAVVYARLYI